MAYKLVLQDSNNVTIWTADNVSVPQIAAAPANSNVPTGGILPYGGATPPAGGWLLCDGSAVSRSTYAALFAVLSTTYGPGNGSTTFNLPDVRQRFPMGQAASGTGAVLGATGGAIDHTHTGPSHTHTVASHAHTITHTHPVPRDGWTPDTLTGPEVTGRIRVGDAAGTGADAQGYHPNQDNTSGASSAANSGGAALTTDAGGTGATGANNPPFQTFIWIVKT